MNFDSEEKFGIFLEVAKVLNKSFNIVPILYGSLGLYQTIQARHLGKINDIDILIPDEFIKSKWKKLKKLIRGLGFKLKNKNEHEFIRKNKIIAFAAESDLSAIGIKSDNLKISDIDGVKFKKLSPKQYLKLYQFMLRDNYRQQKRGNADQNKISLIKKYLAVKSKKSNFLIKHLNMDRMKKI